MSKKRDPNKFVLANERGIKALPHWLRERDFNSYAMSGNNGVVWFGLSRVNDPEKDWPKVLSREGLVLVRDRSLVKQAETVIREHLGWERDK